MTAAGFYAAIKRVRLMQPCGSVSRYLCSCSLPVHTSESCGGLFQSCTISLMRRQRCRVARVNLPPLRAKHQHLPHCFPLRFKISSLQPYRSGSYCLLLVCTTRGDVGGGELGRQRGLAQAHSGGSRGGPNIRRSQGLGLGLYGLRFPTCILALAGSGGALPGGAVALRVRSRDAAPDGRERAGAAAGGLHRLAAVRGLPDGRGRDEGRVRGYLVPPPAFL